MSTLHKLANNAVGLVKNNPLAIGGTNLVVDNALDGKLNAIGGFPFFLTLWGSALTPDTDTSVEIVEVSARVSPNNYTITRAQQGTVAVAWVLNSNVALLWTLTNAQEAIDFTSAVTKGSIVIYGSDFLPHILAVGTNNYALIADSAVATFGVKWAPVVLTSVANTFTQPQTIPQIYSADNAVTAVANATTITRANRNNVITNNSAATLTVTLSTASAAAGDMLVIQILDFSAVAQTIAWVNTENSLAIATILSNGSTTLPITVGFKWNAATSKWRCIAAC